MHFEPKTKIQNYSNFKHKSNFFPTSLQIFLNALVYTIHNDYNAQNFVFLYSFRQIDQIGM